MSNKTKISRRKLFDLGIKSCAAIGLSQTPLFALTSTEKTVHGACYHDCPDACSWIVSSKDGQITRFEGDKSNPFTAGKLCDKMNQFPDDVTFHPDRILTPLKRTGEKGKGEFKPVSWEEALHAIGARLKSIIQEKGSTAILPFSYAGTEGYVQHNCMSDRFFARMGATRLERTICGDAAYAGVAMTNGDSTGVLPEDIVHSRYIILWGTNPVISNQHLWPFIMQAKKKGAKLILVDPFQSATAPFVDLHIQPMPGTDTALALGMIHVILSEELQDQDYVDRYTTGIEELRAHVKKYDPATVSKITGVEAQTIVTLAKDYAAAKPSVIRLLIGLEKHASGGNAARAIAMLPALTGAWRHLGGGLMHFTFELFGKALNWERLNQAERIPTGNTRQINMLQLGKALNDTSLNPPVQAMIVYNCNPAVIVPDQNQVIKGLSRSDLFTVVLEHFITDTARYADYVLPATTQLEHWDLVGSWGQDYINLNEPVIPPRGESKPNSEIFRLLSKTMGYEDDYLYESDLDIIHKTLKSDHPYLKGITFDSLQKTGWARLQRPKPWIPHAEGNFATESKRCEFFKKGAELKDALPEHRPAVHSEETLKKYPLQLLAIKSPSNFLNSSHANVKHLLKKEGPPFVDLHDQDAKARNIADGDEVKVHNERGEVLLTARIKNRVRPGVVCIPQGFWASLVKGGSTANALTTDLLTDFGRGSAMQESRVEITKR